MHVYRILNLHAVRADSPGQVLAPVEPKCTLPGHTRNRHPIASASVDLLSMERTVTPCPAVGPRDPGAAPCPQVTAGPAVTGGRSNRSRSPTSRPRARGSSGRLTWKEKRKMSEEFVVRVKQKISL